MYNNAPKTKKAGNQSFRDIFSAILFLFSVCFMIGIVYISVYYPDEPPILLDTPETAKGSVVSMMDAYCSGEFSEAGTYILGNPIIGADHVPEDAVSLLLWETFVDSMEYELVDDCYTTDVGIAQKVRFSCLDMTSVTSRLKEHAERILEEKIENAKDISEIYDINNEYRQELIDDVLYQAMNFAIAQDSEKLTVELDINLTYQDGKWWVVSSSALIDAIFGDVLF